MPRGVYDRSKLKKNAETTTKPVAKKEAKVKEVKVKAIKQAATVKRAPATAIVNEEGGGNPAFGDTTYATGLSFQILGSNINTLSEAIAKLKGSSIEGDLTQELKETIANLKDLRLRTFAGLADKDEPAEEATEEDNDNKAEAAPAPEASAVNAAPTLPQGNAGYKPPAPPTIPHH